MLGQKLFERAEQIIPGGVQLFSKSPYSIAPGIWPTYFSRAEGAKVWDLDGNEYLDLSHCSVGTCPLGYANSVVNDAVKKTIDKGTMSVLNCPEEVELAEKLISLHPWADMVRYTRGGGEAVAVAVRIARAYTSRTNLISIGYHGWTDAYLANKQAPEQFRQYDVFQGPNFNGIPPQLAGTTIPCKFGDIHSLIEAIDYCLANGGLAAIVVDPAPAIEGLTNETKKFFIECVANYCFGYNAIFICDEVSSGFRTEVGGYHKGLNIEPDIAVFAKAISNGYPFGVVIGRRNIMEAAKNTFISSTYWTERVGPVSALATINEFERLEVHKHIVKMGAYFDEQLDLATWHLKNIKMYHAGIYPLYRFRFESKNQDQTVLSTYYIQEMLKKGFLTTGQFYPMLSHDEECLDKYFVAAGSILQEMDNIISKGQRVEDYLDGPVKWSHVIRRI